MANQFQEGPSLSSKWLLEVGRLGEAGGGGELPWQGLLS